MRNLYIQGGNIEVKATQNYASYAFISKDYAKFRKENNFFVRFFVFSRFILNISKYKYYNLDNLIYIKYKVSYLSYRLSLYLEL